MKELRTLISLILREDVYKRIVTESTPRIPDLTQDEIIELLQDILGREPVISYTEKLAGQFLEIKIQDGEVLSIFKDAKAAGYNHGYRNDAGGTARCLRGIRTLPQEMEGQTYQFEVIKAENRPDYIDYAIGDRTLSIEFTGALSKETAEKLNTMQRWVKFIPKSEIVRRPRPLPSELTAKIQNALAKIINGRRMLKAEKQEVESLISAALVQIWGESMLGGSPEGIFASLGDTHFKIPEAQYANIQRLQAPLYAVFSEKSKYDTSQLIDRFNSFASNPEDRMAKQIKDYLIAASNGFPTGFRSFFSQDEATELLSQFEALLAGDIEQASQLLRKFKRRIGDKTSWIST